MRLIKGYFSLYTFFALIMSIIFSVIMFYATISSYNLQNLVFRYFSTIWCGYILLSALFSVYYFAREFITQLFTK